MSVTLVRCPVGFASSDIMMVVSSVLLRQPAPCAASDDRAVPATCYCPPDLVEQYMRLSPRFFVGVHSTGSLSCTLSS